MADRRRIVTIDQAGTVTTVKDLEDIVNYFSIQNTWVIEAPARNQVRAQRARRYGGARTVFETHDNGTIRWRLHVKGASVDDALAKLEAALTVLEQPRMDLFVEWRADGATNSTYYQVAGPATWTPSWSSAQLRGSLSVDVDVTIPVAPLARGATTSVSLGSPTLPAVVNVGTVAGDAPAMADISLRTSGGTAPPIWALLGWARHPAASAFGGSTVAPFGVVEAESTALLSTWAVTADAAARGGSKISATASGAGTANAAFRVDPSLMDPDDFKTEIDVEIWARVQLASTLVSPNFRVQLEPFAGTNFGPIVYTPEWGSAGRLVVLPSSGTVYRFIKLGTLSMPVDTVTPLEWVVRVVATWAAGSTGTCALDYLVMVPNRARALSASGKPNDNAYPDFIKSTSDTTRLIRSDLSGRTGSAAANTGRDAGLGGSLIELPPGNVDLLAKLSSLVADDPTSDTTSELLSHSAAVTVYVTPRYWIGRGV